MTKQSPLPVAYSVMKRFDPRKHRLDDVLGKELDKAEKNGLAAQDRGVVTGLCEDSLRHSALLDHLISQFSTTKPAKMERAILAALRLGVTNYFRGTPAHAAVNECVNLLPGKHRARGLVNAIVRRATESVSVAELDDETRAALRDGDSDGVISGTCVPFGESVLLKTQFAMFPQDRDELYGLVGGLPDWLMKELTQTLEAGELRRLCLSCAMSPRVWVALVKDNEDEVAAALTALATKTKDGLKSVSNSDTRALIQSEAFRAGTFYLQDYCAQLPLRRHPPQPGDKCLDLCASPGGKTVQTALAAGDAGSVIALDTSQGKINRVQENVERMKLKNVAGVIGDGREVTLPGCGEYDFVLVDAPCSNTGVIARRLEVKHRLRAKDLAELAGIQRALLANAAKHLRPGGTLIYSTCSLMDGENGALVREFLEAEGGEESGWMMKDEELTLPAPGEHDGGYYCVMVKPE